MPQVAVRARGPARGAASFLAVLACLAGALEAGVARADEVDTCIAAAERSQVQRRDAHLRAARDALLACARDACPHAIQKDCKRWLGEVEAALPSVVIRALDAAGHDLIQARVLVDGAQVTDTLDGRALAIDPGAHELRLEAGGHFVVERVVIREGERERMLSLRLPAATPAAGGVSPAVPVGAWITGALGVVGLGAGVYLWVDGRGERSDLYATCGVSHDCAPSAVDSARSKLVAGDVAAGLGLGAVAAAVLWGPSRLRPRRGSRWSSGPRPAAAC